MSRCGVWKRSFRLTLKLPLPHSTGFGEPLPSPTGLKGVGFLQACLLAEPPSRAFLPPCERDARAPSPRCAGNAGVPSATPTAREKTYPSNTNRASEVHQLPPSCRFPPLREGNRARVRFPLLAGGTLRRGFSFIRTFVNSGSAIGIIPIAWSEFTIAPLLQVPPASRGEPRRGSVPPACRGNLKEGVLVYPRFYELWLGDRDDNPLT